MGGGPITNTKTNNKKNTEANPNFVNVSELQVSATRFSSAWISSLALRPLFFLSVRDRCEGNGIEVAWSE